ncbi:MAG: hypothetical protein K6F53_00130 [Lachnospiraceae bacterium]|nr:hypothetical protein [Lachnospiraceae bacterium]
MKKTKLTVLILTLMLLTSACGSSRVEGTMDDAVKEPGTEPSVSEEVSEDSSEATAEEAPAKAPETPAVKDGITEPGEDSVIVRFTWDAVEGADGYEVCEENKYIKEDSFREPAYSETAENSYETGAQDEFDFRIKVRAFSGEGEDRIYSEWSAYASGTTREDATGTSGEGAGPESEEDEEDLSFFAIWEYEGYVDECREYVWKKEFRDCDYDSDGKTDRVNRSWDGDRQTAVYTVEFGNGDRLTVPEGWETGFPHIQGGDLNGDGINEILVTLTYDTGTDPYSYGDMWLFEKDPASGKYAEAQLPLAKGENGAKGFEIEYEKPEGNRITFSIKEAGFTRTEEVEEDYVSSWWTEDAATQLRCVYYAEITEGASPAIRCYLAPFPRHYLSLGFNISGGNGKYETGYIEIDEPEGF